MINLKNAIFLFLLTIILELKFNSVSVLVKGKILGIQSPQSVLGRHMLWLTRNY